jgi:hypothetical protein
MLAPFQHALNVLRHDLPDAFNLALGRPERILLAGLSTTLLHHHLLQRAIETRTSIRRQVMEICAFRLKLGEELLLEIRQEAKGYALAEVAFRDDEEGKAAGCRLVVGEVRRRFHEAVNEVLGLVDGFVGGFVVRDAREDKRNERGGVG